MSVAAVPTRISRQGHLLTVCLQDCIDARCVSELERLLLPQLVGTDQRLDVLFDLQAVRTFDLEVRAVLIALHRSVAKQARRTVYLATRAHIRGLALWLIHTADDPSSSVAMSQSQAESWLTLGKDRVSWALERTQQALSAIARSPSRNGGRP
jgi:anti-anti-sigma regulatory factor